MSSSAEPLLYTEKQLQEKLAQARYKAWDDLVKRFSSGDRQQLANLLAHDWSIDKISISSKHGKDQTKPDIELVAHWSAVNWNILEQQIQERINKAVTK